MSNNQLVTGALTLPTSINAPMRVVKKAAYNKLHRELIRRQLIKRANGVNTLQEFNDAVRNTPTINDGSGIFRFERPIKITNPKVIQRLRDIYAAQEDVVGVQPKHNKLRNLLSRVSRFGDDLAETAFSRAAVGAGQV